VCFRYYKLKKTLRLSVLACLYAQADRREAFKAVIRSQRSDRR